MSSKQESTEPPKVRVSNSCIHADQSVANIQIFEYISEYSLQIIFIFVIAVIKNYEL